MIPRMSVNWSLRKRTFSALQTFRISDLERPGPEASNLSTLAFAILTSIFYKDVGILRSLFQKSTFFSSDDTRILHVCTNCCAQLPGGYDSADGRPRALAHPRRGARAALRVHTVRRPAQTWARGRGNDARLRGEVRRRRPGRSGEVGNRRPAPRLRLRAEPDRGHPPARRRADPARARLRGRNGRGDPV